jgi:hypothetical protein
LASVLWEFEYAAEQPLIRIRLIPLDDTDAWLLDGNLHLVRWLPNARWVANAAMPACFQGHMTLEPRKPRQTS